MKAILLFSSILLMLTGYSQHQIGNYSITFQDAERGNRSIETEIYYPSTAGGLNAAIASGEFPVIVFGHGFVMSWSAYQNLWEEFVPRGYIMVFPRTEGNLLSTDHQEFGWDLEYLVTQIQLEGLNTASPLNGGVSPNTALMGHSMGGGASFLAADSLCTNGNVNLKTLIGLAPAESSSNGVSSINSALSITVPSVVLSGSQDGVTPPADHHIPMYDSLASDCKTFISITGGAHCYFANSNFSCDFGEGTSSSGISIDRAEQHQVSFDFLNLWLDFTLKSECDNFDVFQDSLMTSNRITYNQSCNYQSLSVVSNVVNPSCNGLSGSANISISGGTPGYTEDWGNNNPNNLFAGTYNFSVEDDMGCSVLGSVSISEPSAISVSENIVNPSCNGLSDGNVALTISGGTSGYTESWGAINPNSLSAGSFNYSVIDANGCNYTNSISVSEPTAISLSETLIDPLCFGESNGSISIIVSGGAGGYIENWGASSPTNLSGGIYSVIVTDVNGCDVSGNYQLNEPSAINITPTVVSPTCFGNSDGEVILGITGGTSGYTEDWGSENPNSLTAGSYSVTVTDAQGCEQSTNVTIAEPTALNVSAIVTDPACNSGSDGAAILSISGGTALYSEDWGSANPNNLSAGSYNVIITDAQGCTESATININEPTAINVQSNIIDPLCFDGNDGSVSLDVSGGNPAYTEIWGGVVPTSLNAGTYSVDVLDAGGCIVTHIFTVNEPSTLTISLNGTDEILGNDGVINVSANGGTPAYNFSINGAGLTSSNIFNGLNNGLYTLVVEDDNGCIVSDTISIGESISNGMDEEIFKGLKLYPNPMQNHLIIEFETDNLTSDDNYISISNALGEELINNPIDNSINQQILDVSDLLKGAYVVTIVCNQEVKSFKLIK